jgi:lipopolysaccharide/colanic/teichoic acid biosynthesis glycosyltransferase
VFYRRLFKPALDRLLAAAGLIVLSPVLVILAIVITLRLGRPILFRQTRIGLGEKSFVFLKFRTMTDERDQTGALLQDAQRLTALGHFLRAASLDELPQLWNVLSGDMSLIGPRPLLPQYLPRYSRTQRRRHEVKPGITGLAQILGRNSISWERKFELDVEYVDHFGVAMDARIILLTLIAVIRRDGISQEGHATMPEFFGASSSSNSDVSR